MQCDLMMNTISFSFKIGAQCGAHVAGHVCDKVVGKGEIVNASQPLWQWSPDLVVIQIEALEVEK